MQYQNGNSFDTSILLTCLLRGAGYNAYVVSGYASKKITTMDDTRLVANVKSILATYDNSKTEIDFEKMRWEADVPLELHSKYKIKEVKELKSQFIKRQREKIAQVEVDRVKAQNDELEELQLVK